MKTKIENLLQKLISSEQSFTAYDVTLALRNQGEWALHSNVKDIVHDVMQYEHDYLRDSVRMNNGQTAFVYYHVDSELDNYDSLNTQSFLNVSPKIVPAVQAVTSKPQSDNILTINSRGKIRLRKNMLDKIGVKPGEMVHWYSSFGSIYIAKGYTAIKNTLTSDTYNNIQITVSNVLKLNINSKVKVTFSGIGQELIVISKL